MFVAGNVTTAIGPVKPIGASLDLLEHRVDRLVVALDDEPGHVVRSAILVDLATAALFLVAALALFVGGALVEVFANDGLALVGVGVSDVVDESGVVGCFAFGLVRCVGDKVDLFGGQLASRQLLGESRVLLHCVCPAGAAFGLALGDGARAGDDALGGAIGVAVLGAFGDE